MRRLKSNLLWFAACLLSLFPVLLGLSTNRAESRRGAEAGQRKSAYDIFSNPDPPGVAGTTVPTRESKNEVMSPSSLKRRKSRVSVRKPAAPLVDSALLRFMSTQKKQREEEELKVERAASATNPVAGYLVSLMEGLKRQDEETAAGTITTTVNDTSGDSSYFWLGQYNRNRIAQKLIEMGVEQKAAFDAGEVVQSHVLARTARRRVREFLKERDVMWVKGDSPASQKPLNSTVAVKQRTTPSLPQYGLDDVIGIMVEFGLTGNDIAAIFSHTPSVALMMPRRIQDGTTDSMEGEDGAAEDNGETLEETITRSLKVLLCRALKLRKYDARRVLRTCPGLLTMRGSRSAEQVVMLFSKLGVSTKSLAREKNALPVLLSRSPADLFRIVAFLTSDAVRMPIKSVGPLLRRRGCTELLNALAPVPRIERHQQSVSAAPLATLWGGSSEERREQINKGYQKMTKTAWTLRHEIGCAHLGRIISAYPTVLLLDAKKQILPTADYLMNELGIWQDDLSRVLQLYPKLLGMDVSQMKRVASYLLSIEVEEDALPSIFRAFPALLTLDVEKDMYPVVDFLRGIGVANIGRFVTRLPPVLGYSIENELIPKWKYLSEVCLYSSFELSRFPAYFSYPLDRVIKTRYEYLRDVKKVPTQILAVDRVVRFGDEDFAKLVAGDYDGGSRFRRFVEMRQAKQTDTRNKRPRRKSTKASKIKRPKQ